MMLCVDGHGHRHAGHGSGAVAFDAAGGKLLERYAMQAFNSKHGPTEQFVGSLTFADAVQAKRVDEANRVQQVRRGWCKDSGAFDRPQGRVERVGRVQCCLAVRPLDAVCFAE